MAKHKRAKESTRAKKKISMHVCGRDDYLSIIVQRNDSTGRLVHNSVGKDTPQFPLTVEALKEAIRNTENGIIKRLKPQKPVN